MTLAVDDWLLLWVNDEDELLLGVCDALGVDDCVWLGDADTERV